MSHQPRILFVTLSDDVGSERIVSEMARRGAACAVLGRPGSVASRCRGVALRSALPGHGGLWAAALGVARRAEALASAWRPDAVVPLDDMAAQVLRDLAVLPRTIPALRCLLEASLGAPSRYGIASCRGQLIETAAALGLRVPAQRRLDDPSGAAAAALALGYPLMLKRENTCGGSGVTLVRDPAGLAAAVEAAGRKARAKRAVRRLFGFRPSAGAPLTLQAHVAGDLAMRTVACRAGRVLDGVSFLAEALDPPVTGSSTAVRWIDHPEMDEAARRLVAALTCSGFVSFDFILAEDGSAHLIEMNARPVGSGHLGARFGHDVYGRWLAQFPGWQDAAPVASLAPPPRRVALFPKEMARDPDSPLLAPGADALHDVPWDEPDVLAAYRDRLARRHPGRASGFARGLTPGGPAPVPRADSQRPGPVGLRRLWT